MKKIIYSFVIFFTALLLGLQNCYADSDMVTRVADKEALFLCEYGNKKTGAKARIYYRFMTEDQQNSLGGLPDGFGPWVVYVAKKGTNDLKPIKDLSVGHFSAIFNGSLISYEEKGVAFTTQYETTFTCPNYINIDYDDGGKVCFSNNGKCKDNGSTFEENYRLSHSASTYFNQIKDYAKQRYNNKSPIETVYTDTLNYTRSNIIPKKTLDNQLFYQPNFLKNVDLYIKNTTDNIEKIIKEDEKLNNEENKEEPKESTEQSTKVPKEIDDFSHNCVDFSKTFRMFGLIIILVKIFLPIIIIVKASTNLIHVVTNGTPEELKKQATKLAVSSAAAIMIFFIPTIISTVMSLVNDYENAKNSDAEICKECIFDPFGSKCKSVTSNE